VNGSLFTVLGCGAGPGAPSFFCDCKGCREARENAAHARTRSGALISTVNTTVLLDTSPDLRIQLIREHVNNIDQIFITHWHYDHFGGLGELEYYVKLKRKEPILLYLPPTAVDQFQRAFPDLTEIFDIIPWEFNKSYVIDNVSIVPLSAKHSVETAGFLIKSAENKLAYFPDTAGLSAETAREIEGVDWLICDATFHGGNWFPHSHMSVEEAIELGRQVKARQTVLTHMSIHYSQPVTSEDLKLMTSRHPNVQAAFDGMKINF